MSDGQVKRVYAFIKNLLHQGGMLSNIVEIWESAFPLDREGGTSSLLLPILCCEAAGGDGDQATAIAAAWLLLCLAAKILDDIEDGDAHLTPWSAIGTPQAINAATGLIFASQLALARLPRMGADRELALSLLEDLTAPLCECAPDNTPISQREVILPCRRLLSQTSRRLAERAILCLEARTSQLFQPQVG